MTDRDLTAALANLGFNSHNHRAVSLLPLIEVAWADGRIQRAERRLIGRIARGYGMEIDDPWLERWLGDRPPATVFLAARTVLLDLLDRDGRHPESLDTLQDLLDLSMWVAEAAGGLFGLAFTVTRSERGCIEEIASHLTLGPRLPPSFVQGWGPAARAERALPSVSSRAATLPR